ncbi:MAG TPA: hypothetical protein VL136_04200, partial [Candidatus Babeliales bacterium]|nr:hypothetical protein [Candidatus Babeliales bacterium]
MSKLVRRKKEIGAALAVALQLITLGLIGLILPVANGPHQSANAPADSQIATGQIQNQNVHALTGMDRSAWRASAVYANKVSGVRATQIFNLASSRAAAAAQAQSVQGPETPDEGPTLTSDQEDYPPYSYVYLTGTGFTPGETVDMIVVETDPVQQSFEPWQVVADIDGNIYTSWYIFSTEFEGATLQATAAGETSQLTASTTFTDASGDGTMTVSPTTVPRGSSNNSFSFQFRNGLNAFTANSIATIVVPAGWTAPVTSAGPGSVNATAVGTATVGAVSVSGGGPWTITVPFTANGGSTNGFNLTYAGNGSAVTAPNTQGAYTFTTSTRLGASPAPLTPVASRPIVFAGMSARLAAGAFGNSAGNLTTFNSNTVTATAGQTLLVLVTAADDSATGQDRAATVSNTSGASPLSGGSATLIATNAGSSNPWFCTSGGSPQCMYMYAFRGMATGTSGTVTVNFATAVKNAAVDVIALSGDNTANPIGLTGINAGSSTSPNWNLSGSLTPGSSMLLFGDATDGTTTPPTWSTTVPALFTQLDSFLENEGNPATRTHRLANYFGGPSALSVNGSLSATANWGTIALEVLPAGAASPTPTATATATATATFTPTPTSTPTATATFTPTPTPTATAATTSLVVAAASGTYGGSVSLTATLTSNSSPVSGKTISFTLNGNPAGSGVTNASGVATSSSVTLCGSSYNVSGSPYAAGAAASFVGDLSFAGTSGT